MTTNVHVIQSTYKSEGGTVTFKSEEIHPDLSQNLEREIEVGVTDAQIEIAFETAKLRGVGIGIRKVSGETGDAELQLKTNSTTTPGNDFTITPENGIGWSENDPTPNPFTADVTTLYVSNLGSAKVQLFIRLGVDATPGLPG